MLNNCAVCTLAADVDFSAIADPDDKTENSDKEYRFSQKFHATVNILVSSSKDHC